MPRMSPVAHGGPRRACTARLPRGRWIPQSVRWGCGPARWWAAARGRCRPGTLPCLPSTSGRGCRVLRVRAVAGCYVRDSARPGEVGLAISPGRLSQRAWFWGGVQGLAGTLEPTAFVPFQIFLLPSWRGRRNGEGAGTGRFIGPSLTPPLPGAQIVLEASGAPPQCPDAGAVGGLQWRPLPVRLLPTHVRVAGRLGHHFTWVWAYASLHSSAFMVELFTSLS